MKRSRLRTIVRAVIVLGIASALLLGVGVSSQWRAEAAPSALTGVTAVGTVQADPYSTWYAQMNRDGICALITGCQSASGAGSNWVFSMLVDVPGVGLQTLAVPIEVTQTVPYRSMSLTMAASGVIGSVDADVQALLTPSATGTTVTVTIVKATTSGLAETYVPAFIEQFQPVVQSQLATLDAQQASAGVNVVMKVAKKGRKATARVRVTATTLSEAAPVAAGTVRIMVGRKVVCVTALRDSQATCRFPKPKRKAWVRAVVTGQFDNGSEVWNSARVRYQP